jgi:ADP-heptose:LPS heptosyltransferase
VWQEIILYCKRNWLDIVILWGDRESWFIPYIWEQFVANNTINLIGNTNLGESAYILERAVWTINGNGGIMRIANLVNKYACNIHTVSAYLMQPPVDNISSFNIRPYHYNKCVPCEAATSTIWDTKMTPCVFCNTPEEWACRKAITFVEIKKFIDRILLTK